MKEWVTRMIKHNVRVDTSSNMSNYNCEKIYPLVQERDYWNE